MSTVAPLRRLLGVLVVITTVIAGLLATTTSRAADGGFVDVPGGHTFHADITWLADAGITRGCNPPENDRFCPDDAVTRAQMASFLTRALGLVPVASDFVDVSDGNVHRSDIGGLADAGITRGCNPPENDRFCPDDAVTRAQMAAFLARALRTSTTTTTTTTTTTVPDGEGLFVSHWAFEVGGGFAELPFRGEIDVTVDWGDGTVTTHTESDTSATHTYTQGGEYTVEARGTFTAYGTDTHTNEGLVRVSEWRDTGTLVTRRAYAGPTITQAVQPPLTVTDYSFMFDAAAAFDWPIGDWDTSGVTSMVWMFHEATAFNQPIGDWDTGAVRLMTAMFRGAVDFDQPIGGWDTSNVISMEGMFRQAYMFDQPIGDWDTSAVTFMGSMFREAVEFDQAIGDWDTSSVELMGAMFREAVEFDQPIGDWDTRNVGNMSMMFRDAVTFNQPLADWDTSYVMDMTSMFRGAATFKQDLSTWDVSRLRLDGGDRFAENSGIEEIPEFWPLF